MTNEQEKKWMDVLRNLKTCEHHADRWSTHCGDCVLDIIRQAVRETQEADCRQMCGGCELGELCPQVGEGDDYGHREFHPKQVVIVHCHAEPIRRAMEDDDDA